MVQERNYTDYKGGGLGTQGAEVESFLNRRLEIVRESDRVAGGEGDEGKKAYGRILEKNQRISRVLCGFGGTRRWQREKKEIEGEEE